MNLRRAWASILVWLGAVLVGGATLAGPPAAAPVAGAAPAPAACRMGKLPEGRANLPAPDRPKPVKGVEKAEPVYGTCLVRATDHAAEKIDTFSRHDYSRRQAFNADSSLFITNSRDGGWYLYDARTLAKLKVLKDLAGDAEPQWHPSDPHLLYYGYRNGGMQIMALDVQRDTSRVVADFKGKLPWPKAARAWTKSEGSPSRDGRYWGLQVETENFEILGYVVWDMAQSKLVGSMPVTARPDHVSMSPSGHWLVSSGDDGTVAWSPDFKRHHTLHTKTEHSDLAIGANGHDVYVSIDYQSNDGDIFMVDIETGERTDLIPTYTNHAATAVHISGKAYAKPGWVLVSSYNYDGPQQWWKDKVFAMELRAHPRIYQLASHHSAVKDAYFAEPQATVNLDFTRVLFNSNWGVPASNDVDAYMIRLGANAFP